NAQIGLGLCTLPGNRNRSLINGGKSPPGARRARSEFLVRCFQRRFQTRILLQSAAFRANRHYIGGHSSTLSATPFAGRQPAIANLSQFPLARTLRYHASACALSVVIQHEPRSFFSSSTYLLNWPTKLSE